VVAAKVCGAGSGGGGSADMRRLSLILWKPEG
jgi:hypothetical protein